MIFTSFAKIAKQTITSINQSIVIRNVSNTANKTNGLRHNYSNECENLINKQINMEFMAGYNYLNIAFYFNQDKVALPGFHKFFRQKAKEELHHAQEFMYFQNIRGGLIKLAELPSPAATEWTPTCALSKAIELEKQLTVHLETIREEATKAKDSHLTDFIEDEFLKEQYDELKELYDFNTVIQRVGCGEGLYLLDYHLNNKSCDKKFK